MEEIREEAIGGVRLCESAIACFIGKVLGTTSRKILRDTCAVWRRLGGLLTIQPCVVDPDGVVAVHDVVVWLLFYYLILVVVVVVSFLYGRNCNRNWIRRRRYLKSWSSGSVAVEKGPGAKRTQYSLSNESHFLSSRESRWLQSSC